MLIRPKFKVKKGECHQLLMPKEVCYIKFTNKKQKYDHSVDGIDNKEFYTVRGEMLILDLNKKGDIIGIELVDCKKCKKPCMNWKK